MDKLEGIRMSKKEQFRYLAVSNFLSGKVYRFEAAELLQVAERTISRMARQIEKRSFLGVTHGNRGSSPADNNQPSLPSIALGACGPWLTGQYISKNRYIFILREIFWNPHRRRRVIFDANTPDNRTRAIFTGLCSRR